MDDRHPCPLPFRREDSKLDRFCISDHLASGSGRLKEVGTRLEKGKWAYLDCFSGVSGDMLLSALIDCGLSLETLEKHLKTLPLPPWQAIVKKVRKGPIAATALSFQYESDQTERHLSTICDLIEASALPDRVKEKTIEVFRLLAEAEAKVHGVPVQHVHFHEVGALDSILDITGVVLGFYLLDVNQIVCSALPFSRGFVSSRHGLLPVPAPATLEILKDVPLVPSTVDGELVTPTGAALVKGLASQFGLPPPMRVAAIGYGAGSREFPFPNVLRLLLAEPEPASLDLPSTWLSVLEAALDDLTPEGAGFVMERLFAAGALDVLFLPAQMKKNRPGFLLQVLSQTEKVSDLLTILFSETTTLGVRSYFVQRWALPRESLLVTTPFGPVRIKVARYRGRVVTASPEFEDCRRCALEKNVPLKEVYSQALKSFWSQVEPVDEENIGATEGKEGLGPTDRADL
ncbi:MAG: nickel pincer cofactor biosynthesis protein LarC [Armatimonadetes bacterium]|nr:nickel pincer cofactor biosynthesis protein LarC [Armatimonadota bacterium]MDW8121098.1 nickel pincer cofactor biosynthesis protein LarC [Armatimonadota bacterium]